MTAAIERLTEAGVFGPFDLHFARMLASLAPRAPAEALLGGAWASRAVASGHVCADLRRIVERPLVDRDGVPVTDVAMPSLFSWVLALSATSALVGDGSSLRPLVFDGEARLYLYRWWQYERTLARSLVQRASAVTAWTNDELRLGRGELDRMFATGGSLRADTRQREAAAVAATRGLTVLSGGPGTGKTTTVVRMLALMQSLQLARTGVPLRIALAAPTGKAAARLGESITAQLEHLPCSPEVRAAVPRVATTIHRMLGRAPGSDTQFRHNHELPLPVDVVVIDEASMVDLALMAKLVDATPEHAKLVLVGDKHQLASVEAGAILGDVCDAGRRESTPRSSAFAAQLHGLLDTSGSTTQHDERVPAIADCLVDLVESHRFGSTSAIGRLADAIKRGQADEAAERLQAAMGADAGAELKMVRLDDADAVAAVLTEPILAGYSAYLRASDPQERLARLGEFRLLSPHRRGPLGVDRLNLVTSQILARHRSLSVDGEWYDGRPVLVTANDPALNLFNGDVGVVRRDARGRLRAYFGDPAGGLRTFAPSRLPAVETVFAMTVHKSQGSEFDRIGILVPQQLSSVLTRELLYTAIKRARRQVTLFGTVRVVADAIGRRIERASGLRDALWGR
jgi:exodeoxyribonuclease V alpha subunit